MDTWLSGRSLHGGFDEVPLPEGSGRLWLCGKHFVAPDPEAALALCDADHVVCLSERDELAARYGRYVEWLERNIPERATWWPVADLHAPELDEALDLLGALRSRVDAGESLLVHCGAGIGRAGTVAAGLLIEMGLDLEEARALVAACRPMAGPEVGAQSDLLVQLAER
jgi:protein-tyrosine phosphatase